LWFYVVHFIPWRNPETKRIALKKEAGEGKDVWEETGKKGREGKERRKGLGKKERKDREGWQIKGMARKEKENKKGDKKKIQGREEKQVQVRKVS